MRLYRHITSFRILRNPCNKQGFHSTARHFIPDNPHNVSNPPGSEIKMLSQHKAYEMVKNMNELDRDNLRCALNQFELDQIKIKFEGKVDCRKKPESVYHYHINLLMRKNLCFNRSLIR